MWSNHAAVTSNNKTAQINTTSTTASQQCTSCCTAQTSAAYVSTASWMIHVNMHQGTRLTAGVMMSRGGVVVNTDWAPAPCLYSTASETHADIDIRFLCKDWAWSDVTFLHLQATHQIQKVWETFQGWYAYWLCSQRIARLSGALTKSDKLWKTLLCLKWQRQRCKVLNSSYVARMCSKSCLAKKDLPHDVGPVMMTGCSSTSEM